MEKSNQIESIKSVLLSMSSKHMFVDRQHALNLLLQYNAHINQISNSSEAIIEKEIERQAEMTSIRFYNAEKNVVSGRFGGDFSKVPKNSVAVVPVMGAMMRDTYCTLADGYISGTRDLERTLMQLDNNENVDGVVLHINTPGGEARGNESLSKVVKKMKTPTVGFFEGMASAGVYAFQGVDELYAAEKNSFWGSIGTYVTLVDDAEFWKMSGIDFVDIYAPDSTEKNKSVRDALNGDVTGIQDWLGKMNDAFIADVKNSRPEIKNDGKVFKGKLYTATEAHKLGAIDGIKNLDYAIGRARYLSRNGKEKRNRSTAKNQTVMSDNEKKLGFFAKLFGEKATTEDAEKEVSEIETKTKELQSQVNELTEANKEKDAKIAELETANKELTELKDAKTQQIDDLQAFKKSVETSLEGTEFEDVQALADDHKKVMEHNKSIAKADPAATPLNSDEENTSHKRDDDVLIDNRSHDDIQKQMAARIKANKEKENK